MTTIADFLHAVAADHQLRDRFNNGEHDRVFDELAQKGLELNDKQKQVLHGGRLTEIRYSVDHETGVTNSPQESARMTVTWVVPR